MLEKKKTGTMDRSIGYSALMLNVTVAAANGADSAILLQRTTPKLIDSSQMPPSCYVKKFFFITNMVALGMYLILITIKLFLRTLITYCMQD